MTEETRWLDETEARTWLALWSVNSWLNTRLDEQLKRDQGVNLSDYFTLAQISMAPDEQVAMTELAALSDMSASRTSHVVSRLEKHGWVLRAPDPTNRRSIVATLTDAGRAFIQQAAPGHVGEVRKLVFDALSPDEVEQLLVIMEKVQAKLEPPRLPRT